MLCKVYVAAIAVRAKIWYRKKLQQTPSQWSWLAAESLWHKCGIFFVSAVYPTGTLVWRTWYNNVLRANMRRGTKLVFIALVFKLPFMKEWYSSHHTMYRFISMKYVFFWVKCLTANVTLVALTDTDGLPPGSIFCFTHKIPNLKAWCVIVAVYMFIQLGIGQPYSDVRKIAMASQITSVSIVYSTICSWPDQRKHQSSASLAFVRGIHRWLVNSPNKGPETRERFLSHNVIMNGSCKSRIVEFFANRPTTALPIATVMYGYLDQSLCETCQEFCLKCAKGKWSVGLRTWARLNPDDRQRITAWSLDRYFLRELSTTF